MNAKRLHKGKAERRRRVISKMLLMTLAVVLLLVTLACSTEEPTSRPEKPTEPTTGQANQTPAPEQTQRASADGIGETNSRTDTPTKTTEAMSQAPTPQKGPTEATTPWPTDPPWPGTTANPVPLPTAIPVPLPDATLPPCPTEAPVAMDEPVPTPTFLPCLKPTPRPTMRPTATHRPGATATPTPAPTARPGPSPTPSSSPNPCPGGATERDWLDQDFWNNTDLASVRMALSCEPDVDARNSVGETPLHLAANATAYRNPAGYPKDNAGIIRALLAAGARVNAKDQSGDTPLHRTAHNGNPGMTQALLHGGADVNIKNHRGWTPLHRATQNDDTQVIRVLLDAGANVNTRSADGSTPLHAASWTIKTLPALQALLDAGADVNATNDTGDTPPDVALTQGNSAALRLLMEHWAATSDTNPADHSCDNSLRNQFMLQRNASTPESLNAVISHLRNQRPDQCPIETWNPAVASETDVKDGENAGCKAAFIGTMDVPAGLHENGAADTNARYLSGRDRDNNIIIHWKHNNPPSDRAKCWLYVDRLRTWSNE